MNKKLILSVLTLFTLSLPACGPSGTKSSFKNFNDDEDFEIHTAEQKAFLAYSGDYVNMPDEAYPDGKQHLSDSNPITLTWDYTVPEGKEVAKYSIVYGQQKDLSDGYRIDGSTRKPRGQV